MRFFEKEQFVSVVVIIVMVVLFVFLQYLPISRKAQAYGAKNVRLIAANALSKAQLEELPQFCKRIEDTKKSIGNYSAKIPEGRAHGAFLQEIADVMQKYGLTELVLQPGSEIETDKLSCIPIVIKCKGKSGQIFQFFKSLETFARIIQIEEVNFQNSRDYNGVLSMQMKTKIFYRTK